MKLDMKDKLSELKKDAETISEAKADTKDKYDKLKDISTEISRIGVEDSEILCDVRNAQRKEDAILNNESQKLENKRKTKVYDTCRVIDKVNNQAAQLKQAEIQAKKNNLGISLDKGQEELREYEEESERVLQQLEEDIPSKNAASSGVLSQIEYKKQEQHTILENSEPKSNSWFKKDGIKCYTDDEGKVYKQDDELLPDITYKLNGYTYTTDSKGRISSAGGKLKLKKGKRNALNAKNVGGEDKLPTDDRGHLIADRFDGSNQFGNLVAMDSNLNRGSYKKLEDDLAKAVEADNEVYMKVKAVYRKNSERPSLFVVEYSINGKNEKQKFKNEGEVKYDN